MTKKDRRGAVGERFKALLRNAGYKATPARLAILELMDSSQRPLSAQGIIDELCGEYDPVTVYRTVRSLRDSGIIQQVDLRHNHAHYEVAGKEHHHHAVCTHCGTVEDLEYEHASLVRDALARSRSFAVLTSHSLEFFGLCKKCAIRNS